MSTPPLHVAQLNLPSPEEFRDAFEAIFARDFYTNHGPLEQELDAALSEYFDVRHAIGVVNATTALMLTFKALDLKGDIVTSAFTFPATAQAAVWAGLNPVFCDIDPETHGLKPSHVADLIGPQTSAILGVHAWGRGCHPVELEALARQRGVRLVFDAAHAVGCSFKGRRIGGFGDAEIFSFHATKVLNGLEGGCITTNDDALADRLRTMRSFHAGGAPPELWRMNAKMSEAQAAMTLLGLRAIDGLIADNRKRYELYRAGLADIRGVTFVDHAAGEQSNYQYVVISISPRDFGRSRDSLIDSLHTKGIIARRYFHPGVHEITPFSGKQWVLPETDALCRALIQLPTGQAIGDDDVANVCAAIRAARA